jgi:CheY-like chemotaxis protein
MTPPDASRKSLPAAQRPDVAARRREIVSDIRHDLKNAHFAAASGLRQLDELVQDQRLKAVLAGLEAAIGEVRLHSERSLELLALGIDDIEPSPEPMALEPVLREVEMARRAAAEQAGIKLRTLPSGAVAAIDRHLLTRCVGNLVTNAIEHSGATKVSIGVRRRGAGCGIEVRDNGRGVDPEAVRGLDGRRWAEGTGRGLGLWIASRFAALLGGELEVRAQAGRGSCFRVMLPGPVSWAPGSPQGARPNCVRLDGRIVVLLEDDASQLQATRLTFERRGATVIASRNQIELWNEIEQLSRPPDLCVLDFVLGRTGLSGTDGARVMSASAISWLKKRFGAWTKVVILTANRAHPQLAGIGETPIFEKPLNDRTIDAIVALLQATPEGRKS